MKIYLINPKFPVTYWGFEYSNDLSGLKYTSPPLGLATVAALTPPDIDVEICDENIEDINFDNECDVVGLTAYLVQGPRAFQIAAEFRKRGKLVVIGGPITSLDAESCRGKVDVRFVGEAELTWKQFLNDYRQGEVQAEYVQTEKIDMRHSPVPRFDLLKLHAYSHAGIQTTRGCPFNCEFCDIVVLFGRKVRCKDISQIIDELREAAKQPIDSVFFTDDNFVGNRKYAKKLLRAIIDFNATLNTPLQYMTQVSVNLAKDDELLQLLYEARFTKVFVGIETPRKASLQEANKGQNIKTDLVVDVRKIQSYNIGVSAGMIVGFDHDDTDIFQEQFDFIMETDIAWAMTGILQAVPKTPLYKRLEAEHRLDTSMAASTLNNTVLDVNIIPKNMSKEELISGYQWLLKQLYSYENYAKRVIGSLKAYSKKSNMPFYIPSPSQLRVVARTFRYYLLTLDRKRRRFFMQILKYVLLKKPSTFYDAMVHLVSFKHLHTYVFDVMDAAVEQKSFVVKRLERSWYEHADTLWQQMMTLSEELRKHASQLNAQAMRTHDELTRHSTALGQQALEVRDDLRQRAASVSHQAASRYDELRHQLGNLSHYTTTIYDQLEKQAGSVSQQMAASYQELGRHAATMSKQVAVAYEELGAQAALLNTQVASVSKQLATAYSELEIQANAVSRKAIQTCEEIEHLFQTFPPM